MRQFRLLTANEIECRINQISEKGCGLLLYKTARIDYQMLDETFGMMGWKNDYKVIDGKMYCGIGIKDNSSNEWIWKWNCGTESNTEAEKGQASDAMKRAGFCWGIGTELYSAPFIWIPADLLMKLKYNEKNGKYYCYDTFTVKDIGYDDQQNINKLVIVNQDGNTVFPKPSYNPKPDKSAQAPKTYQKPVGTISNLCKECGAAVTPAVKTFSERKYGYCLCVDCQKKYDRQ